MLLEKPHTHVLDTPLSTTFRIIAVYGYDSSKGLYILTAWLTET